MIFYDTCSLLDNFEELSERNDSFIISSITLEELEQIKTSHYKDEETKYLARKILHFIDTNRSQVIIYIYNNNLVKDFFDQGFDVNNDIKILACACDYYKNLSIEEQSSFQFVTNDIALKTIAFIFLPNDKVLSMYPQPDDYCGYSEVVLDDDGMNTFYSNPNKNLFELKINEYLIIKDTSGEIVDSVCWTGEEYRHLSVTPFFSKWFGEVKPFKKDVYQLLLADSFLHNKLTLVKGPAGSGKTYLSLGYLMSLLDKGKIDKIIVFCNTVATKNSAKLGYLPGTRDEKLLDSQIGNVLASKFGSRIELERLIADEKIVLLPFSDIRGYDTTGMNAGIYISEAQNLDITLMKLALQRIGEDSICIIDGDEKTQVDDIAFAGKNNGMRRLSKVYRGSDIYGEVELRKIHRSKIANIAERM